MTPLAFIHGLRARDIPPEVLARARLHLLDLAGVAAAGASTDLSRIARGFAVGQLGAGAGGARLLFDGRRAGPAGAAYAGASTIDAFDAHDGHALTKGHAGVAVLPALLAVADAEGLDLAADATLTAFVMGVEVAVRAGIALHAGAADYHTSGAWNALGCAAVGARLLGLRGDATRHALGIAEYHGPRSPMMRCIDHPTMLKDGSGWGALGGVAAAYLARDGFTGAPAVTAEAPEVWADLGARWRVAEQYLKPWPVCRWAQPAIEAAAGLVAAHGLLPGEIAAVEIETFAEAVRLGTARPATTEAAQYALGFPLAAFLARGRLGAEEIGPAGLADPMVAAMLARIALREDPALSARFPAERLARVTIRRRGGAVLASPVTAARGDPDRPLGEAEVVAKFRALAAGLDPARAEAIVAACLAPGGTGPSAGRLLGLLAGA